MRTRFGRSISVVLALFVAGSVLAQVRGNTRVQGTVTNRDTGHPIAGAKVSLSLEGSKPIVAKSNRNGQWAANGLTAGSWSLSIEAEGFQTLRGSVAVTAMQAVPPILSQLGAAAGEGAGYTNVPGEVIDAVTEAQELLAVMEGDEITKADGSAATATAAEVKENGRKAAALLVEALPQIPTDTSERKRIRNEVLQLISQAHAQAGDVDKAIEVMQSILAADPANHNVALLLVNLYFESSKLAEARALLDKVPESAITDSEIYIDFAIPLLNSGGAEDALKYLDKAVALDPEDAAGYYYRGMAYVRLKKTAEARADFEKTIALAPEGAEAEDARQALATLK